MSIKQNILAFLRRRAATGEPWVFGGQIEDFVRETDGHKASNASRRCRELENEGKIERQDIDFEGKKVVQYRVKTTWELAKKAVFCSSCGYFVNHAPTCATHQVVSQQTLI